MKFDVQLLIVFGHDDSLCGASDCYRIFGIPLQRGQLSTKDSVSRGRSLNSQGLALRVVSSHRVNGSLTYDGYEIISY